MTKNIEIIKQFKSKNNAVYLAKYSQKPCVYKKFAAVSNLENEYKILTVLAHTNHVPKILEKGSDYLLTQYIEGELLLDLYEKYTSQHNDSGLIQLADMLAIFLHIFHTTTSGQILDDANFRNFIIMDGKCYGIDFDQTKNGNPHTDIAGIVAFAVSYTIEDTSSTAPFVKQILTCFHLSILDILSDITAHLEIFKKRRTNMRDIQYLTDFLKTIC